MRLALILALAPSLFVDDCCDLGTTGTTESPASTSDATTDDTATTSTDSTSGDTTLVDPSTGTTGVLVGCGNGEIDAGEECDGGVLCDDNCVRDRVVFVSGVKFSAFSLGGPDGTDNADAACQQLAAKAGLDGTFKAWLSTKYVSPSMRFNPAPGRYARTDGKLVAKSWADLTDGSLLAPIRLDAFGKDVEDMAVWTGTVSDGDWSASSCGDWAAVGEAGTWGVAAFTDSRWTEYGVTDACATTFMALYCVEQGPGEDPCASNQHSFEESVFAVCTKLSVELSTCLGFMSSDWCATCENLYDYCKNADKGDCAAALGECLQCVYAHGNCTQQAECGLGDGACVVP